LEIVKKQPSTKGTPDRFIGDVWIDRLAGAQPREHIRVNVVRFAPGARNGWHAHALGQTLFVTEGIGRVQAAGEEIHEIRAGDTIYTAPGEWHWHGAAPDHFMTHLAMWEAPEEGPESEWGSPVSDEEYRQAIRAHGDPSTRA
jgi:quercetin dioxygenase-like cupin family protein